MFSIVLQDLLVMRKSILLSGIYIAVMLLIFQNIATPGLLAGTAIFTAAMIAVTYMLIGNACAYADKSKVDVVFNSMPVNRIEIVAARYLSVYMFFIIGIVYYLIVTGLINLAQLPVQVYPLSWEGMIGAFFAVTLMNSVYLPVFFKWGYVNSRMINFILFFVFFFGGNILAEAIYKNREYAPVKQLQGFIANQSETLLRAGFILLILVILFVSILISARIYINKEF
ncbi:MAG: ABC-2 transporter permease [Bacillota bacterium]